MICCDVEKCREKFELKLNTSTEAIDSNRIIAVEFSWKAEDSFWLHLTTRCGTAEVPSAKEFKASFATSSTINEIK